MSSYLVTSETLYIHCSYGFLGFWDKVNLTREVALLASTHNVVIYAIVHLNIHLYVTPCFDSLAVKQIPYTKDTSSQHWYALGFKG